MKHASASANQAKAGSFPASPSQGETETPGQQHPQSVKPDKAASRPKKA